LWKASLAVIRIRGRFAREVLLEITDDASIASAAEEVAAFDKGSTYRA
jgi:hypothetical protein